MDRTGEQQQHRERFFLALIEATHPLQHEGPDREVTLELLIEADLLEQRLQAERQELRSEETD